MLSFPMRVKHRKVKSQVLINITWWRHQMETFSALLAICAGNSLVTGEFPAQRPVTQNFDVFFDLPLNMLNKQLNKKHSRRWLWRHHNMELWTGILPMQSNKRPIWQIPECTCVISHNALFRTEVCTFLFCMAHCGIWDGCILWIWFIPWSRNDILYYYYNDVIMSTMAS